MTPDSARVSAAWLALREPADAAARALELVEPVRARLGAVRGVVIHDLGAGTGSMGRWLAPRVPGPQHWIMYDHDADLLRCAEATMIDTAADGTPVSVETRQQDITRLATDDLRGAGLVTASAVLDMLTAAELDRIVAACAGTGCPALLTISVVGRVELTPPDPLDAEIAEAFNAHQRRTTAGRGRLGPAAVEAAIDAFSQRGVTVQVRPSPWRLGAAADARSSAGNGLATGAGRDPRADSSAGSAPRAGSGAGSAPRAGSSAGSAPRAGSSAGSAPRAGSGAGANQTELISQWLRGWVAAACAQRPELVSSTVPYVRRRLADAAAGRLGVVVHHTDLLAGCT